MLASGIPTSLNFNLNTSSYQFDSQPETKTSTDIKQYKNRMDVAKEDNYSVRYSGIELMTDEEYNFNFYALTMLRADEKITQ